MIFHEWVTSDMYPLKEITLVLCTENCFKPLKRMNILAMCVHCYNHTFCSLSWLPWGQGLWITVNVSWVRAGETGSGKASQPCLTPDRFPESGWWKEPIPTCCSLTATHMPQHSHKQTQWTQKDAQRLWAHTSISNLYFFLFLTFILLPCLLYGQSFIRKASQIYFITIYRH